MVGREVQLTVDRGESHPGRADADASPGLHVKDDRGQEVVHDVDFEVRAGEIFGIAGVAGNGQDELVEALIGLRAVAVGPRHARRPQRHRRRRRAACTSSASGSCRPTAIATGWC